MIPYVAKKQIAKLDYLMVNHFKIPVSMMMELAGYRLADFIRQYFPKKKNILICVGKGNNGGDGLAAARHLKNFGFLPIIFLITKTLKHNPQDYFKIIKILKIPYFTSTQKLKTELQKTDIIYDCLIGYNLKGELRGKFTETINLINQSKKLIIACDIPSGIDTNKGPVYSTHVKATYILFLSLPKQGCQKLKQQKYVADIGVPLELYPKIKIKPKNYFKKKSIIKIK